MSGHQSQIDRDVLVLNWAAHWHLSDVNILPAVKAVFTYVPPFVLYWQDVKLHGLPTVPGISSCRFRISPL